MTFRLGYSGIQEIKNHPFFDQIDWQKIKNMEYQPPFSVGVKKYKEDNMVKFREVDNEKDFMKYPKIVGYSFN